ncbi:hypothetical protein Aph01nite_59360 [Acrocarpospora phusangensis]|uniref:Uncharacterized protein n=1 Tax=Acrocarpospora phusangensis TaxID=1070424 RepID=A0A919QEZ5_9ACTN|nr:hypothetical protein Aph01nite_59360 [Acrocarpospora phusangensis]
MTILFAPPNTSVIKDIRESYAHLDIRSGPDWELYIAGYRKQRSGRIVFNERDFDELQKEIEAGHQKGWVEAALSEGRKYVNDTYGPAWKFSGTADLVSFMAYDGPQLEVDWLTLRAVQLLDANGSYRRYGIGEIVEILRDWRKDNPEFRDFAPGESPELAPIMSICPALSWLGSTAAIAISGNAAYDLLKVILGVK